MKADSFCSIICDIQHAADLSDGQKKRLLLLVYYIKDTDISLLKNMNFLNEHQIKKSDIQDIEQAHD